MTALEEVAALHDCQWEQLDAPDDHIIVTFCGVCENKATTFTDAEWPCETWVAATQSQEVLETYRVLVKDRSPGEAFEQSQALAVLS